MLLDGDDGDGDDDDDDAMNCVLSPNLSLSSSVIVFGPSLSVM